MKIESISIKNYKTLQNVEVKHLPDLAVFIGKNGTGKTTFFDIFSFLYDSLHENIKYALEKRGGYSNVISRGHYGEDIFFTIKFRLSLNEPLITYELSIGLDENKNIVINKEIIRMRRGENGAPWIVLKFSRGEGFAAIGNIKNYKDVRLIEREKKRLKSPDILAIKGLGQFDDFATAVALQKLIEDLYVADFNIDTIRENHEIKNGEHLTRTGDNLAATTKFIHDNHPEIFKTILNKLKEHIPDIEKIEVQETQDGRIILSFQDEKCKDPFSLQYASDGSIKMFIYLVLLHLPTRHALLCIKEPERHLHHELLEELAEEFEYYSFDSQVFISTHSPKFLNAIPIESIYCFEKNDCCSIINRAIDNPLVKALCEAGDQAGELWSEGILTNVMR